MYDILSSFDGLQSPQFIFCLLFIILSFNISIFQLSLPIIALVSDFSVVVPINRKDTTKVHLVQAECVDKCPIYWQTKLHIDPNIKGDIGISWMYSMLFPPQLLQRFPIINFHAGPPGPHALKRAMKNKDNTINCKWHWVNNGVDTGPTIINKTIALPSDFQTARQAIIHTGLDIFPINVLWDISITGGLK